MTLLEDMDVDLEKLFHKVNTVLKKNKKKKLKGLWR